MNAVATYWFRGERAEAVLRRTGAAVTEDDLEGKWEDLASEASGLAYLLSDGEVVRAAEGIATMPRFDPAHDSDCPNALEQLARHDNCAQVISDLIAKRNDVIASILSTRDYCFNDVYPGQYGDLYLTAEDVLHQLRPALPPRGRYARLDLLMDECPDCFQQDFGHEDGCEFEARAEDQEARRAGAVASHLHCSAMGHALVDHMRRCLDRVEVIAHRVRTSTSVTSDGALVVDPHEVLEMIRIEDLNTPTEPLTATALVTAVHPPMEDLGYCDESKARHHTPHRACRFLVS